MQEKTISGLNFVKFMHEVAAAFKEGYALTLNPRHAPSSTPTYSVTLVLQEVEGLSKQEEAILKEVVLQETVNETKEEAPAPVEEAPKKQQGRPARK
jgi:hypothetical protein